MATVITASIGTSKIKMCEVSYTSKSVEIQKAFTIEIPEGYVDDGRLVNMEGLTHVIGLELANQGVLTKDIIFALNSSKIVYKEVYTPVLKPAKLSEMIKANASEYFPMNLDEYIIAEKVISQVESAEGEKQLRVAVYAAAKTLVDGYYRLAESLGLTVKNIESYTNANVSMLNRQIGKETSVVIQVHENSTTVTVFHNNVLELQRTVPYGKSVVIQAVMEEQELRYNEAEALIAKERLIHNTFDGDAVTDSLRYLVNSIVRVVEYYTSRNSQNPVELAFLTGESVNMLGLENLLANEFNFSVMQIMEFKGVNVSANLVLEHKKISMYIACVGAVIDPVNFLPDTIEGRAKQDKSIQYLLIGAAASLLVGIILILIPFIQRLSLKSDIGDVEEKIEAIKEIEMVVNDYYDSYDRLSDAENFKALSSSANDYLLEFIKALEKGMPSDISIRSMSVDNGNVSITAVTSTKQSIAKFITQLNGMSGVAGVFVSNSSETKDEFGTVASSFTVTLSFNEDIEQYVNPQLSTEESTEETTEGEVE